MTINTDDCIAGIKSASDSVRERRPSFESRTPTLHDFPSQQEKANGHAHLSANFFGEPIKDDNEVNNGHRFLNMPNVGIHRQQENSSANQPNHDVSVSLSDRNLMNDNDASRGGPENIQNTSQFMNTTNYSLFQELFNNQKSAKMVEKNVEARIQNDAQLLELAHPKLIEKLEHSTGLVNKLQSDLETLFQKFLNERAEKKKVQKERDQYQHQFNLLDHELEILKRQYSNQKEQDVKQIGSQIFFIFGFIEIKLYFKFNFYVAPIYLAAC